MTHSSRKGSIVGAQRSRSASLVVPTIITQEADHSAKRTHSLSISSVTLTDSTHSGVINDLVLQDYSSSNSSRGKIRLMDDVDLEKQIILTAGGKREYVCGFILKLLFLTFVVLGCGVLIFYAL